MVFFFFFFFSSRRRHTRSLRDWSSDVCSSDLIVARSLPACTSDNTAGSDGVAICTRSEERRVGKSVDLGGRRIMKKKKKEEKKKQKEQKKKKHKQKKTKNKTPHK